MSKRLPPVLAITLLLSSALFSSALFCRPAVAGPIRIRDIWQSFAFSRRSKKLVTLEVTNSTFEPVKFEIPSYYGPVTLQPRQTQRISLSLPPIDHGLSLLYWRPSNLFLQATLSRPTEGVMSVNLSPSAPFEDDRAIYTPDLPGSLYIF